MVLHWLVRPLCVSSGSWMMALSILCHLRVLDGRPKIGSRGDAKPWHLDDSEVPSGFVKTG
jgi:hypothetical protein